MTDKYGPWIAFNPGDTPPADDVMVQEQPVRGKVVFNGSSPFGYFSMHPATDYRNPGKPARVTLDTADGLLIPGTYTSPDGAQIMIEVM